MNIFTWPRKKTPAIPRSSLVTAKTPGYWILFGILFIRPQASRRLCHVDVYCALFRFLWCGHHGQLNPVQYSGKTRPADFVRAYSQHFDGTRCQQLSRFRDHHGTEYYLFNLGLLTTVVSLVEEF